MLVNNAGVAHDKPIADLSAEQARELLHVKVVAPTMPTRAAVPGMLARGTGTIVNVAGMIAFSGPASASQLPRRAVYAGSLAHTVAMSQTLSAELQGTGVKVQVVCPGVVATQFHTVQGMDLSAVPRMTADDVVAGCLRGLELGEVVCAPGVEDDRCRPLTVAALLDDPALGVLVQHRSGRVERRDPQPGRPAASADRRAALPAQPSSSAWARRGVAAGMS